MSETQQGQDSPSTNRPEGRFSDETVRRIARRVWQLWQEELRRDLERRSRPAGKA